MTGRERISLAHSAAAAAGTTTAGAGMTALGCTTAATAFPFVAV